MGMVNQMPQSSPRAIVEGTDRMNAWLLASSPTNPTGITPPLIPPDPEGMEKAVRHRFITDCESGILRLYPTRAPGGQGDTLSRCWRKRRLLAFLFVKHVEVQFAAAGRRRVLQPTQTVRENG